MSKNSLKMSMLVEERQYQNDQIVQKEIVLRKRWIVVGVAVSCVVLAFCIAAGILAHQHNQMETSLNDINEEISSTEAALNYQQVNKTIRFTNNDSLELIRAKVISNKQSQYKAFRHLDLLETQLTAVQNMWLPTVITATFPPLIAQLFNVSLGISEFHVSQTPLIRMMNLNSLDIIELDTADSGIHTLIQSFFNQMKSLKIQNEGMLICSFTAPLLQYLLLNNTNSMELLVIKHSPRLAQIDCNNCSGSAITIHLSGLVSLKGLCRFKMIDITDSPVTEIGCINFPNLTKLSLNNTKIVNLSMTSPKLVNVRIINTPLQSFEIFRNSIPFNYFEMRNSAMTGFVQRSQMFGNLILEANTNFTLMKDNNFALLSNLQCFACSIESVVGNNLPDLKYVNINGSPRGKLREWTNNYSPMLDNLRLSMNELRVISGNDFSQLATLMLSNNYLGEKGIQILITTNIWNPETLKMINISDNNISNKTEILNRLLDFFPGVEIII